MLIFKEFFLEKKIKKQLAKVGSVAIMRATSMVSPGGIVKSTGALVAFRD
ncbi:hypothetical protein ACNKU7_10240 [Microbulbifer sp. SA54]